MNLSRDLREFIALLNSTGVDYLLVGGHAVAFHGYPRFTGDIDFFVATTWFNPPFRAPLSGDRGASFGPECGAGRGPYAMTDRVLEPEAGIRRRRPVYALGVLGVIAVGLLWRSGWIPLPPVAFKYGGDLLWALACFLGLALVFPRWSTLRVCVAAFCFTWSVEFLQLYHGHWIEWVRSTRLGRLVLGTTFNAPDLLAYLGGIGVGALGERAPRRVSAGSPVDGESSDSG